MKEENSKNKKMIFVYGLIMLVCVACVVVIGLVTGPKGIEDSDAETQTLIDEKQNNIRLLEEKVSVLESEVDALTVEKNKHLLKIEELEEQLSSKPIDTSSSDGVTMAQALADLKGIYELYKTGSVQEAKEAFNKIEPMGYDDATLAYYEILGDILGKNK